MPGTGNPVPFVRPALFANRYLLGDVLGRGAMADVFRAKDQVLGRVVAVKIYRHGRPVDNEARIEAEKRTLASLSHPGLVMLFDAGTAADTDGVEVPYLAMELVDGPTLGVFRGERPMAPHVVARIGRELASALTYIHSRGVVHRDIKPANVLIARPPDLSTDQSTKLTDFGIARIVDAERLTEHGMTIGTAHYLSPEQATGTAAGPASDVYSLGLVLIECLTGQMVFEGSAVAAAVARLHRDPTIPSNLDMDWASLLTAMTARQPQDRPPAAAVAHRLTALAGAVNSPTTSVLPAGAPLLADARTDALPLPAPGRSRAVVLTAAAALVALFAAGAAWAGLRDEDAPASEPAVVRTSEPPAISTTVAEPTSAAIIPAPVDEAVPVQSAPAFTAPPAPEPVPPPKGNGNGNGGNGNSGNSGNGNGGDSGNGNGGNGNGGNGNSGNGNSGRGNRN
ncbi:MAG: serine/threonine-protein kinase [Rhodococcus sp. (in: high G+C Gram-positive bacteria)]